MPQRPAATSRCNKGEPGFALVEGTQILAEARGVGPTLPARIVVGAEGLEPPTYAL